MLALLQAKKNPNVRNAGSGAKKYFFILKNASATAGVLGVQLIAKKS
jgi:hypothetical protein